MKRGGALGIGGNVLGLKRLQRGGRRPTRWAIAHGLAPLPPPLSKTIPQLLDLGWLRLGDPAGKRPLRSMRHDSPLLAQRSGLPLTGKGKTKPATHALTEISENGLSTNGTDLPSRDAGDPIAKGETTEQGESLPHPTTSKGPGAVFILMTFLWRDFE